MLLPTIIPGDGNDVARIRGDDAEHQHQARVTIGREADGRQREDERAGQGAGPRRADVSAANPSMAATMRMT